MGVGVGRLVPDSLRGRRYGPVRVVFGGFLSDMGCSAARNGGGCGVEYEWERHHPRDGLQSEEGKPQRRRRGGVAGGGGGSRGRRSSAAGKRGGASTTGLTSREGGREDWWYLCCGYITNEYVGWRGQTLFFLCVCFFAFAVVSAAAFALLLVGGIFWPGV